VLKNEGIHAGRKPFVVRSSRSVCATQGVERFCRCECC
jgi:hypothetical protein